jgi:hypothetical protein
MFRCGAAGDDSAVMLVLYQKGKASRKGMWGETVPLAPWNELALSEQISKVFLLEFHRLRVRPQPIRALGRFIPETFDVERPHGRAMGTMGESGRSSSSFALVLLGASLQIRSVISGAFLGDNRDEHPTLQSG